MSKKASKTSTVTKFRIMRQSQVKITLDLKKPSPSSPASSLPLPLPFPPTQSIEQIVAKLVAKPSLGRFPNAFILYRNEYVQYLKSQGYHISMTELSSMISSTWKKESKFVKDAFTKLLSDTEYMYTSCKYLGNGPKLDHFQRKYSNKKPVQIPSFSISTSELENCFLDNVSLPQHGSIPSIPQHDCFPNNIFQCQWPPNIPSSIQHNNPLVSFDPSFPPTSYTFNDLINSPIMEFSSLEAYTHSKDNPYFCEWGRSYKNSTFLTKYQENNPYLKSFKMQRKEDVYVITKGCTSINQLTCSINYSNDGFRMSFFYDPPDDHQIYHITCEEIKSEKINDIDIKRSDHIFYHSLDDKNFQITCNLISNTLIAQYLNKERFGIKLKQVEVQEQECLTFSNTQQIIWNII
ncbi:unnamed protein product [Rhizophagus irregularis]|nr:unnamed protein product [Rhizophagus irregularis]CAB4403496.1 unnamed protein product [Rhizophagus irregularis]